MDYLRKLETTVLHWVRDVPHLPTQTRRWLGTNAWWIMLVTVIVGGIWALFTFFQLMTNITILDSVNRGFLVPPAFVTPWSITTGFICLSFSVLSLLVAAFAVKPLQNKIKEGWVLLFVSWLVLAITVILYAVLSLNPLSFIIRLLFGAIFVALAGYVLFEIHSQFAHNPKKAPVEKSSIPEAK
jgi:hypothetical protein